MIYNSRVNVIVETVLDWNHLEECVAGSGGVGDFRSNLNCQLG